MCQLGAGCRHNDPFQVQSKRAFNIGILLPGLLRETPRVTSIILTHGGNHKQGAPLNYYGLETETNCYEISAQNVVKAWWLLYLVAEHF